MAPEAAYRSTGVAAVITAGGRLDAEFSKSSGVSVKALLRVADETIIERVIRVTKCAESVDRTIVVGPNEVRDIAESSGAEWIIEAGRGGENAVKGALHAGLSHERVIVVASDLPFMESCHLDKFLSSVPEDVSLSVPLIWKQSLETRFPGSVNSFTRVKEGEISPGSLIFVNPKILLQNSVLIDNAFTARKSELRMAKLLGIPIIISYLTKRLSINQIEKRIETLFGCAKARAILDMPAELAFDIDDAKDYDYVLKHIADHKKI